jgi:hypothetical protein
LIIHYLPATLKRETIQKPKMSNAIYLWLLALAIGMSIGIGIGAAMGSVGAGAGIGMGVGIVVGIVLYRWFERTSSDD